MRIQLTPEMLTQLRALRAEPKFASNPIMNSGEKAAMARVIDAMLHRLVKGLEANPTRDWVVEQIRPAIAEFYLEDTEVREPCVGYVMRVYKILGLGRSAGAFKDFYVEF